VVAVEGMEGEAAVPNEMVDLLEITGQTFTVLVAGVTAGDPEPVTTILVVNAVEEPDVK